MKVICNATPLINFAAINRLDILKNLFAKIIIPEAVYRETTQTSFPNSQLILNAIAEEWLQVEVIKGIPDNISNLLDPGEREAIALALFNGETRILLDEQEARKIAKSFELQVIGTLGILILAKKHQIISQVKPPLEQMRKEAQYWVSDSLVRQILEQVEEL
ncbi:MAG: DUF3368 domain-containing protein [Oscillatoria sp. SIO1A7]|nr:DUF3368 domain-containing protein [Oscillatoria sp. SIO1A7]